MYCPDCEGSGGFYGSDEHSRPEIYPCHRCHGTGQVESTEENMSICEFIDSVLPQIKKKCYLAIVPSEEGYDVEVEVSSGVIAGNYWTEGLKEARFHADHMQADLAFRGVEVFEEREDWEAYLAS